MARLTVQRCPRSDAEIIRAVLGDDREPFAELVTRYQCAAWVTACGVPRDEHAASDARRRRFSTRSAVSATCVSRAGSESGCSGSPGEKPSARYGSAPASPHDRSTPATIPRSNKSPPPAFRPAPTICSRPWPGYLLTSAWSCRCAISTVAPWPRSPCAWAARRHGYQTALARH